MKANRVTITIKIECMSIDAFESLFNRAGIEIGDEYESGKLVADDGDSIEWSTERKEVEF